MFCTQCGKQLAEESNFCTGCGTSVKQGSAVANPSPETIPDYSLLKPYFQQVFTRFDAANGRYQHSWNWPAFLWTVLWYWHKQMWQKGLVLLVGGWIIGWILSIIFGPIVGQLMGWLALGIFCGTRGNYDYYLARVKNMYFW